MSRKKHFDPDPDNNSYYQPSLYSLDSSHGKYNPYPPIVYTKEELRGIIHQGAKEGMIGCDLEFNPSRITVLGASSKTETGAIRWDAELAREMIELAQTTGATICGHSTLGAEKQKLEEALNIKTAPELYDCSMVAFHLVNGDLTKMAGKEDSDDAGALGLMGLGTVASVYTNLPHWKDHRGKYCSGPCPECGSVQKLGYCAVDSWASVEAMWKLKAEMKALNIPHSFYRDCMALTDICIEMENNGLRVDRQWVREMDKKSKIHKDKLFPFENVNGKSIYTQFNPKSTKQIVAYCLEKNIDLRTTKKAEIVKALEKQASREGFVADNIKALCEALECASDISPALDTLYRLYSFKHAGKGTKSWFDDRYFSPESLKYLDLENTETGEIEKVCVEGYIHARFVTTGTCTGRLSSSKPNMTNLGARGWALEIKKAIIPPDGYDFVESDFSQLELRVILYLAGFDMTNIGEDAFAWLVTQADGAFTRPAVAMSMSDRDVAKSVSHGSSYLEGIQILTPKEYESSKIQTEIKAGARAVYLKKYKPQLTRDWLFRDGIVTFTGANLAERLFGDKTLPNRKKALEITEDVYFNKFFAIREWQMTVLEQAEKGYVQTQVGRYLRLYGTPAEDAKTAVAFYGQGLSADHVRAVMLRFKREINVVPALVVHDSIMRHIPKEWSNKRAAESLAIMQEDTPLIPGLMVPGKTKRGATYGDLQAI